MKAFCILAIFVLCIVVLGCSDKHAETLVTAYAMEQHWHRPFMTDHERLEAWQFLHGEDSLKWQAWENDEERCMHVIDSEVVAKKHATNGPWSYPDPE